MINNDHCYFFSYFSFASPSLNCGSIRDSKYITLRELSVSPMEREFRNERNFREYLPCPTVSDRGLPEEITSETIRGFSLRGIAFGISAKSRRRIARLIWPSRKEIY